MSSTPRLRITLLLVIATMAPIVVARGVAVGQWWAVALAAVGAAFAVPAALTVAQHYGLAWFCNALAFQPEFHGWRHPVWRGSDDWPGDDTDTYWRRTLVLRIPGRRYLVVAIPIRRKHNL